MNTNSNNVDRNVDRNNHSIRKIIVCTSHINYQMLLDVFQPICTNDILICDYQEVDRIYKNMYLFRSQFQNNKLIHAAEVISTGEWDVLFINQDFNDATISSLKHEIKKRQSQWDITFLTHEDF